MKIHFSGRISTRHFRHPGHVPVFSEPFLAGPPLLHHRGQRHSWLQRWHRSFRWLRGSRDQSPHPDPGLETVDRRAPSQSACQCQESTHNDPRETLPFAWYARRGSDHHLESIFNIILHFTSLLGHSALMCRVDGSHYGCLLYTSPSPRD